MHGKKLTAIAGPGLLESEGPCSALFECGSCAFLPSTHNQEDGLDTSGTHESSDDGGHRRRHRQERIAGDGTWGYVLHALQAGILKRSRRALAPAPYVFLFANGPRSHGERMCPALLSLLSMTPGST